MQPNKVQYSAQEAARKLGISEDEFARLVRAYIDPDLAPTATFHPSDLVVLRIMATNAGNWPSAA